VLNKFNAYSELWLKTLRAKEEGGHIHPLARRHARQVAAEAAATGGSNGTAPAAARQGGGSRSGPRSKEQRPSESWRISTTHRNEADLRNFYQNFVAAKTKAGDQKTPSFDAFARENRPPCRGHQGAGRL